MNTVDIYYYPLSPPSRAVLITANYLGLKINLKEVNIFAGENMTEEFTKLNPTHTVPVLVDNDGNFVLWESCAIMQYLCSQYANSTKRHLYPDHIRTRARVDRILYLYATAFFPAVKTIMMTRYKAKQTPTKEMVDNAQAQLNIVVQMLGEQKFFAGHKATLADISISTTFSMIKTVLTELIIDDKLNTWYDRLCEAVPQVKQYNDEVDYSTL